MDHGFSDHARQSPQSHGEDINPSRRLQVLGGTLEYLLILDIAICPLSHGLICFLNKINTNDETRLVLKVGLRGLLSITRFSFFVGGGFVNNCNSDKLLISCAERIR
jgi:hypothetical protein